VNDVTPPLLGEELERPVVLLVGGATGTGKSTVATEVAHRLGITRVTSTDFIRQTIRAFFSPAFMPSVHYSSFEGDPTIPVFLEQTQNVLVGVEAVLGRALAESWSIVLEGVHLVPGLVPEEIDGAVLVHAVLRVESEAVHRTRFHVRDAATGGTRAMEKYLDRLDAIRAIQDYIVDVAERNGVPVIESTDRDRAATELMELVLYRLELEAVR
jgi:2-phosphoglycerate kinase